MSDENEFVDDRPLNRGELERIDNDESPFDFEIPDGCILIVKKDAPANEYDGPQVHKGYGVSDLDTLDTLSNVVSGLAKSVTGAFRDVIEQAQAAQEENDDGR